MKKILLFIVQVFAIMAFANPALIPMPQEVTWGKSEMKLRSAKIFAEDGLSKEVKFLQEYLATEKIKSTVVTSEKKANIVLKLGKVESPNEIKGAYSIEVTNKKATITAKESAGIFWGIQTLRQMIEDKKIATATIKDWPVHQIRGFMHDVGRNFISVPSLKEHLELMALYKYNVFHFHVTENQGWRLESKIYPELTDPKNFTRKVDKFYSQEEFKDLVKFCHDRHIILIPELDLPGHSLAFRKAFNVKSMGEERVTEILVKVIDELCELVPAEMMPYIHLGSDEVRHAEEKVDAKKFFPPLCATIRKHNREVLGWVAGMLIKGDNNIIQQVWAPFSPVNGVPWIDSRTNYINHLDNFMAASRMIFQKPGWDSKNQQLLGGIICSWPDSPIVEDRGIFEQNPIFICTVCYAETIWRGRPNNERSGWANIPAKGTPLYDEFVAFENRMITHRDRYFKNKEFNYVRQANIPWRIIHFPEMKGGDSAPVETEIKDQYEVNGKVVKWLDRPYYGAAITFTHFWGHRVAPAVFPKNQGVAYAHNYIWSDKDQEVGFWISFQEYSRSDWRGAPIAKEGQWHNSDPLIWINDNKVEPPKFKNAGKNISSAREEPLTNENVTTRPPTKVKLKKGWNKVLIKVPSNCRKWMFICVPVEVNGRDVREVEGLKFSLEAK